MTELKSTELKSGPSTADLIAEAERLIASEARTPAMKYLWEAHAMMKRLVTALSALQADTERRREQKAVLTPSLDVQAMRDDLHATFNGGWDEEETRSAFHHGMDTVCNVIESRQKGEGTNGVRVIASHTAPPVSANELRRTAGSMRMIGYDGSAEKCDLIADWLDAALSAALPNDRPEVKANDR